MSFTKRNFDAPIEGAAYDPAYFSAENDTMLLNPKTHPADDDDTPEQPAVLTTLFEQGRSRGKNWAKQVSNKLGKAKKWFDMAKSALGHLNKFYKANHGIKKND